MDSIQLTLAVYLKKIIQHPRSSIFKQNNPSETNGFVLATDFISLKKTNADASLAYVNYQNELGHKQFNFLCKHNLLFFLTVTRQFNIIEKLFKIPTFFSTSECKNEKIMQSGANFNFFAGKKATKKVSIIECQNSLDYASHRIHSIPPK